MFCKSGDESQAGTILIQNYQFAYLLLNNQDLPVLTPAKNVLHFILRASLVA